MKENNPDKPLAQVFHFDLYGERQEKYDFLGNNGISSIEWTELQPVAPNFFFVKKDFHFLKNYEDGFSLKDIFIQKSSGVETRKDALVISDNQTDLQIIIDDFKKLNIQDLGIKYKIDNNSRDWKIENAKNDILKNNPEIKKIQYRPFDNKKIIYTGITKGINGYPMYNNFKHFFNGNNIGLTYERQFVMGDFTNVFISDSIVDGHILGTAFSKGYTAPLYLYPEATQQQSLLQEAPTRKPNLDTSIVQKIADAIGLPFVSEKANVEGRKLSKSFLPLTPTQQRNFSPLDILDYIYAVLHSPTYRETYKEFLKIDFPRVPYPKDAATFWQLVALGGEIRQIHLLESEKVEDYITGYPVEGENVVGKVRYVAAVVSGDTDNGSDTDNSSDIGGKVYLNDTQYFSNVPEVAWSFYIGGYQPAQKWLKDRKERQLSFDDILHYQKIIVALVETDRLMKEVDKVGVC